MVELILDQQCNRRPGQVLVRFLTRSKLGNHIFGNHIPAEPGPSGARFCNLLLSVLCPGFCSRMAMIQCVTKASQPTGLGRLWGKPGLSSRSIPQTSSCLRSKLQCWGCNKGRVQCCVVSNHTSMAQRVVVFIPSSKPNWKFVDHKNWVTKDDSIKDAATPPSPSDLGIVIPTTCNTSDNTALSCTTDSNPAQLVGVALLPNLLQDGQPLQHVQFPLIPSSLEAVCLQEHSMGSPFQYNHQQEQGGSPVQ